MTSSKCSATSRRRWFSPRRSPPQLLDGSDGVIRGKAALREYWQEGLRRIPDLHFEVSGVYVGVGVMVINYRNQKGGLVNEVLIFDGELVKEGYGTYLDDGASLAGAAGGGWQGVDNGEMDERALPAGMPGWWARAECPATSSGLPFLCGRGLWAR